MEKSILTNVRSNHVWINRDDNQLDRINRPPHIGSKGRKERRL